MKDSNFYAVQGWMVNKLHLSGNELICYAIIYGFSQDGMTLFMGSISYLQKWMNVSRPTVINTLKTLIKKGLLNKHEVEENNVRLCYYGINEEAKDSLEEGSKESILVGSKESILGGSKESIPNNIKDNKEINKEKNKDKSLLKKISPEEQAHNAWFKENFPILAQNKRPLKLKTLIALQASYTKKEIIMKLNEMEAKVNFNRKYSDVGRVLYNWLERDKDPNFFKRLKAAKDDSAGKQ